MIIYMVIILYICMYMIQRVTLNTVPFLAARRCLLCFITKTRF